MTYVGGSDETTRLTVLSESRKVAVNLIVGHGVIEEEVACDGGIARGRLEGESAEESPARERRALEESERHLRVARGRHRAKEHCG